MGTTELKPAKLPKIIDIATGEAVQLDLATPEQISAFLTDLSVKRRKMEAIEKKVKKFIQEKVEFAEDDNGQYTAMVGNHKLIKTYRSGFSSKLIESKGSEADRLLWDTLSSNPKYQLSTEYITWK